MSVTFSNIYPTKLKIDKVEQTRPLFYKHFVADVINSKKKNKLDSLLMLLNNYHANIILTVEVNPYNFLDKNIKIVDGKDETSVYR